MGSYKSTQVDSLAKTQGTRSHKTKIIMSTPVKTYSKLELLKLRPAQTCQKIAQTAEFQRMLEITKSIPIKCQDSDGSETERANAELVEGLKAKEELRMAKKHRNFLSGSEPGSVKRTPRNVRSWKNLRNPQFLL